MQHRILPYDIIKTNFNNRVNKLVFVINICIHLLYTSIYIIQRTIGTKLVQLQHSYKLIYLTSCITLYKAIS